MTQRNTVPLILRGGHLFLEVDGGLWLVDTGATDSFGAAREIRLVETNHVLQDSYGGLTPGRLSAYVSEDCAGLLGVDILNQYDFVLDLTSGTAEVFSNDADLEGHDIPLEVIQGAPILTVRVRGADTKVIFDTGAQVSYLPASLLDGFPRAGTVTDFYNPHGTFPMELRTVDLEVGPLPFRVRCGAVGAIPGGDVGRILAAARVEGILGNEVLEGRRAGYFPRRRLLVL